MGTHEVDADGGDVALRVGVISEAQQEAGLADARIADEHELEDVVILLRRDDLIKDSRASESVQDFINTPSGNSGAMPVPQIG